MPTYSEFRFYSPIADDNMVRVSMCDDRGSEFFMTIPDGVGKGYRMRREEVLSALELAIHTGLDPGRVTITAQATGE